MVQDKGFEEKLPDMKLIPLGATKSQNCKYGNLTDISDAGDMDYWIMEVDGGTATVETPENFGYTIYTLRAPQVESGKVEDGVFKFTLPEKSKVAEAGYIDGYRVTIKSSDDMETIRYYKIDGAGKEVGVKANKLVKTRPNTDADSDETVSFELSVCEYIREPEGKKLYGPESSGSRSMEQDMDDMLEQMGALTGKITISMGWRTHDDLDLHCTTPSGEEIAYYNKQAGGGELDVDMNADEDNLSSHPVENIYFEDPDPGEYHIWIDNYCDRTEGGSSEAVVRVTIGDKQYLYHLQLGGSADVMTFKYGEDETEDPGDEYLDKE